MLKLESSRLSAKRNDHDEAISREDITTQFNLSRPEYSAIKRVRNAYGDIQIAVISLYMETEVKLIKLIGKIG